MIDICAPSGLGRLANAVLLDRIARYNLWQMHQVGHLSDQMLWRKAL